MDSYSSEHRRRSRARDRHIARLRKRASVTGQVAGRIRQTPARQLTGRLAWLRDRDMWLALGGRVQLAMRDLWWHLRNRPQIARWIGAAAGAALLFFFIRHALSGNIYPNTRVLGVGVGGRSIDEAEQMLAAAWDSEIRIDLRIDGDRITSVRPDELGIRLDARATARDAKGSLFSGIPFGRSVTPVVELDYIAAQTYLLELTEQVNFPPVNARYEWRAGQVAGIEGHAGQMLDVTLALERLAFDTAGVVQAGRLDLPMSILPADTTDPSPYLEQVRALATRTLLLHGYDPFSNEQLTWPIGPEVFINWLEAGPASLGLRTAAFLPFVDALNSTLNPQGGNLRYIAPDEASESLRAAIAGQSESAYLRIRYRPTVYTVQANDTGHRISRRTGIPYYLIEQANSGRNMDFLSIGDQLNIPSRDVTLEFAPVPNKRIVVNLTTQYLIAFENGQVVFEWEISSGVPDAPTSPGIYQILNHDEVAYGSSVTLCDEAGLVCGQWAMNWFMGIYQVIPGLVNGFHGAVLLPNGAYLAGGSVGFPATFGCIMSRDDVARQLYEWAEVGTMVEIISNEFEPMSDLGRLARELSASR